MGDAEGGSDERGWLTPTRGALIAAGIMSVATIIAAIIGIIPSPFESGGDSTATFNGARDGGSACNGANFAGSHNNINCAATVSPGPNETGLSSNPRARIVELKGSWSEDGFVEAIVERDTPIVALYLKSGMDATTVHKGASAVLWGFQGVPQNGDPVALVKTFEAGGFKLDDELQDGYLMDGLTEGFLPLMFETDLAPDGYTGGYQGGVFTGPFLFWIVQRATWAGPTADDTQVIEYLISQGADCEVPLSFLEFNRNTLGGTSPYRDLLSMMQSCAE